ncbi:MAG: glutamate-5-semialdehyde dehydrogenase [Chloroflexaceae bacterium]|nr:glutamate-5-semialdehyde dehydrogenase [Chloroflexaceae bacterium]NJO04774.1 glutamate-5-semialdehyde dehydrogenase [Chloroflexaceae bacterium]
MTDLPYIGQQARAAARHLSRATTEQKNAALHAMADLLDEHQDAILDANASDMRRGKAAGLRDNLLDRMLLTPQRLATIARDTRNVARLPDPVGETFDHAELPNGLRVHKRRTPLGVVGFIYEARPNVTVDAAALCVKAGNATVLRGGSDISASCGAITHVVGLALEQVGLPATAVQSITDPNRDLVRDLLRLDQYIDVIVPRGGAGLHRFCLENATIPVITGGIGVCHIYVDATAAIERAVPILYNARVQRPSVCNSMDVLLVQREIAPRLLPAVAASLGAAGVEFRADQEAFAVLSDDPRSTTWKLSRASAADFATEFLALILAIRVVDNLDEALEHIALHSTGHSEAILTNDSAAADRFVSEVDSAAVFVNASTRFNDGGEFGLGAEIAVSTQKLHARGPMGLQELTTFKWVGAGDWLVRA